jgi:hypothetical protein
MGEAGPPSGTGMPPVVPAALRSTSYLTYRGARAAGRGRINLRRPWLSLHGKSAPTQAAEGSATARPHEGLRSPCRPPGYQRCRLL